MKNRINQQKMRGFLAVEVAVLTPLLLLFFMMTIELGFFFFYGYQLQEASYRGARYAASHCSASNCIQVVKHVTVYGVPNNGGERKPLLPRLQEDNVNIPDFYDGHVSVEISYVYQPVFPLTSRLNLNLQAQTVMRLL